MPRIPAIPATIDDMPESVRPALRRLARRLALGVFLDAWPAWAAVSLLAAGSLVLICRLFFPAAARSQQSAPFTFGQWIRFASPGGMAYGLVFYSVFGLALPYAGITQVWFEGSAALIGPRSQPGSPGTPSNMYL